MAPQKLAVFLLGASALLASARSARAEQFVLFDATFDYTWDNAINSSPSKSHYYVNDKNVLNTERPKNWLSPVDYRNGTVHIRTEVFQKPAGDQQVGWVLCYIANQGGYGCTGSKYYKSTGVFENDQDMTKFWNNDTIQWDKGIKQMDLVYTINDSGTGHVHYFPELKDATTPTRVRITMVQVSAGSTYDPSILEGTGGMGGAGGMGGVAGMPSGGAGGAGAGGIGGGLLGGAAGASAGAGGYGGLLDMGMGGGGASSGGASSAGAAAGGATTAGAAPSGGTPSAPSGDADSSTDSGCSVSSSASHFEPWGALGAALAGLALVARTRRQRR